MGRLHHDQKPRHPHHLREQSHSHHQHSPPHTEHHEIPTQWKWIRADASSATSVDRWVTSPRIVANELNIRRMTYDEQMEYWKKKLQKDFHLEARLPPQ
ncbi:hypothetical protein HGRIS_010466 [Hohenbuehelia grisea]|uniref:Uncharacterized protein n=1 Tax=Hohenbuehelia grisea TaxID=104357 RepID=A0ABR3IZB7_9AGAR